MITKDDMREQYRGYEIQYYQEESTTRAVITNIRSDQAWIPSVVGNTPHDAKRIAHNLIDWYLTENDLDEFNDDWHPGHPSNFED